jgi:hypothetical protein
MKLTQASPVTAHGWHSVRQPERPEAKEIAL